MKELRFHGQAIVTGRGSIDYLKSLPIQRAFIVTGGQSTQKNGSLDKLKSVLTEKGALFSLFAGIPKNPSVEIVAKGINAMREFKPDTVIGIGGGSAIDAAKIMSVFYENPELDLATAFRQALPQVRKHVKFIAIPSTSGTATEVTCFAVMTYKDENIKVGGKSPAFVPDYSILDADLTLSMPPSVVAETGMDAMTHAVECYCNKNLDDFTECLASGAIEGLFKYLPISYEKGDVLSREKVHNYQSIAGCAFSNVGTGMDHGIAHAMGGKYDLAHGLVIAIALPHVLKFNTRDDETKNRLAYLAKRIGSKDFIESIKELNKRLNIPASFKALGLEEATFNKDFDELVENSLKGATKFNPAPVSEQDMRLILRSIYEGTELY